MDEARARRVVPACEKAAAALVEARGFVREADLKGRAVLHRTWRRSCGWRADFFRLATRQGDLLHVEPELGVEVLVPGEKPALVDARPVYYLANGRHAQYALGMVDEL